MIARALVCIFITKWLTFHFSRCVTSDPYDALKIKSYCQS